MSGCVLGPATNGCRGYPQRRAKDGRNIRLHREVMEQHLGRRLRPDEHVLHRCGNKRCLSVECLRIGTHAEAMALMVEHGRSPAGERNGQAKLTERDVRAIRGDGFWSRLAPGVLAHYFGVHVTTVRNVLARRTWKHL